MVFKNENRGFKFRILEDEDIYEIHLAALEILENTGVVVNNAEALDMLSGAGCFIGKKNLVKMPSFLVEKALRMAPKGITLSNRDGKPAMRLEGHNTYFGPVVDNPIFHDPFTGEYNNLVKKNLKQAALVADNLKNIDFVSYGGNASDIPEEINSREIFKEVVQYIKKPIVFNSFLVRGTTEIIEIATEIAGGPEKLRQNPFIIHYSEPTSPLIHDDEPVKNILLCADKGIPLIYIPMPMGGATAPATLSGILAQNTAEVLSGLVISQLRKEGSPFIFGGIPSIMDMSQTMIYPYGAPEMDLLTAGLTDIAHYYKLPVFGTVGCDSKSADQQCAIEATSSCMMSILSGNNLVHDVGQIQGKILSLETVVMVDEIVEMLRHTLKPIKINKETLALDIIDKVGPSGNFLSEEHTLKHFRNWWFPNLIDRTDYKQWVIDSKKQTFTERLNNRVKEIIDNHEVEPLPKDIIKYMNEYNK